MNRDQAKLLAPIICAYAAGSIIEARHPVIGPFDWTPTGKVNPNFEFAIKDGWQLRIAPKPPKQKFARIALCNLAKLTCNNYADFPCHQIQSRTPSDGKNWSPVEVIVRKGYCKDFEQHPTFVKWLSAEFPLTTQHA